MGWYKWLAECAAATDAKSEACFTSFCTVLFCIVQVQSYIYHTDTFNLNIYQNICTFPTRGQRAAKPIYIRLEASKPLYIRREALKLIRAESALGKTLLKAADFLVFSSGGRGHVAASSKRGPKTDHSPDEKYTQR